MAMSWQKKNLLNQFFEKTFKKLFDYSNNAGDYIEKNIFRKYSSLNRSKRFIISWLLLIVILFFVLVVQNFMLSDYYQVNKFIPGGVFSEGIVGTFTNANPIYATSDVDSTVSHLLFASLFTYNNQNKLVGDLASSYSIDTTGRVYTIKLKPNLFWQDGRPLTSQDVVFTYNLIQNPDTQSPFQSSFQGIKVTATNPTTVVFKLPDVLSSFIYSLTNGIVPEHILGSIPPIDMRSALFNTNHPIGSGPFSWQGIEVTGSDPTNAESQIQLVPNKYFNGGQAKLSEYIIKSYPTNQLLQQAFLANQVIAAVGLSNKNVNKIPNVYRYHFLFTAGTYVFFKTSSGFLTDQQLRQALVMATNVPQIINSLGYVTHQVSEPLLVGQLGYNPKYKQSSLNLNGANQLLQSNGWLLSKNGYRYKNNQLLQFSLTTLDTPDYTMVANLLQKQWQKIGVKLNLNIQAPGDFNISLQYHQYDALLYDISIGIDPDVFIYWDSSQANPQLTGSLNFSEFKNSTADESLESGRTRLNPALRVIKYQSFLNVWQQQAPAVGLYQPGLILVSHSVINGLRGHVINTNTDIFANLVNWEIDSQRQTE